MLRPTLKPVENPRPLDDDEFLELYELTYEECMELVASGAIQDAKTIIASNTMHFISEENKLWENHF